MHSRQALLPSALQLILFAAVLGWTATVVRATERVEITLSAAISLKNAFEELGALYEKQSGDGVLFNFGASGQLLQQLIGGAPVDVFASAAQQDADEQRDLLLPRRRGARHAARSPGPRLPESADLR